VCGRFANRLTWEELVRLYRLMLQRWPVSKRVNSSKAPDDDPALIDRVAA
jgi:hypothetical protein